MFSSKTKFQLTIASAKVEREFSSENLIVNLTTDDLLPEAGRQSDSMKDAHRNPLSGA